MGGSNEANDKASVATGKIATRCLTSQDTAKTPGATGAPLRLIGWQVENVNAWFVTGREGEREGRRRGEDKRGTSEL